MIGLLDGLRHGGLVAIDGLPCSGKSTLAERLVEGGGFQCIAVDEFFLPESAWRADAHPAFPLTCSRNDEFITAIRDLAGDGRCRYFPFDWDRMQVSSVARVVERAAGPVVVEGMTSLQPVIADLYDVRIFVESDRRSALDAILRRDGDYFGDVWRTVWLPSADIYMQTNPRTRADYIVIGRGVAEPP